MLEACGVTMTEVAKVTGINHTVLAVMRRGERKWIRQVTEDRVLAVDPHALGSTVMAKSYLLLLHEQGLTQQQIADRVGISRETVLRLLNGKLSVIRPKTLAKIMELAQP